MRVFHSFGPSCLLTAALCVVPFAALYAGQATSHGAHANNDGFNPADLDRSVKPGENFFEFADGGWIKAHPIPSSYSGWGVSRALYRVNQKRIRQILQQAAADTNAADGSVDQKIGDFYASGMNVEAINAAGIKPLAPELARIDAITDLKDLQTEIARLQGMGVNALFDFGEMQDFRDSTQVVGVADQGGLGLPDRSYYLDKDKKSAALRTAYVDHVAKMLELSGVDKAAASEGAKNIMQLETRLAEASMTRVARRDPHAIYHPTSLKRLHEMTPDFSWQRYFALVGVPQVKSINVTNRKFFEVADKELKKVPLNEWKMYLRWHLLNAEAPYLSRPFVDEDFAFSSKLTGAKALRPRWQRVASAEDNAIGFTVGKLFVEKYFSAESKRRVMEILDNIETALRNDIMKLDWMTPATKKQALKKLSLITEKVGYPDKWRDYSKLTINRGPYVLNTLRAAEFETQRELNKIGKPVDRSEWGMTPQTVNAYYNPSMNEIVFPAGILQPPFFNPNAPAAINYGEIGAAIGHEITHGFDDQGSQYDGQGNLRNWWTAGDLTRFKAQAKCITDQFSTYTVAGGAHVQGNLVTGEAIADLGGLKLAYLAYHASDAAKHAHSIGGFTPDQLFFWAYANSWAASTRPKAAQLKVRVDPHPPAKYRVNGTVANMPQFKKAWHLTDSSPMVNKRICQIW
ncbi:MAG TPA: M13 family metallopeptidase [Gammaproteobacteria bacterium]|nr:M13 family metallopeptidase [Gammaproteobacteria bacterium]